MKVIALVAENVKKLRAVEILPTDNLVKISGANGAGKSSVLDALWWGFAGKSAMDPQPIREGEKKAIIRIELDDLIITRTISRKNAQDVHFTTGIKVEKRDGSEYQKPQFVIDGLLGRFTFDPMEFLHLKPDEQFEALKALVPGFDFAASAAADKTDFAKRTDENREAKRYRTLADGISLPAGSLKLERVDVSDLTRRIGEAAQMNDDIAHEKRQKEKLLTDAEEAADEIERLEARIGLLRKQVVEAEEAAAAITVRAPIDVAELSAQLQQADETNRVVELRETKHNHEAEAQKHEEEAERLTREMETRRQEREAAISKAKMPVKGLGFGDGEVLLNGHPFKQGSDAEKLRASMGIAMALNPEIRIVRVREGSLLDENSLELVRSMAAERDYQVWLELVDTSGKVGFVIEDGEIVSEEKPQKGKSNG